MPLLSRCALLGALVLTLTLTPAVTPASAATTGANLHLSQMTPAHLAKLQRAGAKWIRLFHGWSEIEPAAKGQYNGALLAQYKLAGQLAHAHGIKLDLVVLNTPMWANGGQSVAHPPTDPGHYADYVGMLVGHMGADLDAIEIWNEPDGEHFWLAPGDHAPGYVQLLRGAYAAAKAANPAVRVILGGMQGSDHQWLERVYAHGGGGSFDVVATHPDTACLVNGPYDFYREADGRLGRFSFLGYRAVRDVMVAHGDAGKPIIMTEIGWSTAKGLCERGDSAGLKNRGVTEAQQAAFLLQAHNCLAQTPYVESAWWFNYADLGTDENELHKYGLLRHDLSEKPAWAAFTKVGTQGNTLQEECGDFHGPNLSVTSPGEGIVFADSLPIAVRAADRSGVARIQLDHGTTRIRSFTPGGGTFPADLSGKLDWQRARRLPDGAHTLTVTAIDRLGNASVRRVQLTKVHPSKLPKVRTRTTLSVRRLGGLRVRATARVRALKPVARTTGKVRIAFEKYDPKRKRWVALHKYARPAKAGRITITRKVRSGGTWRVVARYARSAPLEPSSRRSPRLRLGGR